MQPALSLNDIKATGTFCLFLQAKYDGYVVRSPKGVIQSSGALLDITGIVRFENGEARITSSDGLLIFTDENGNELDTQELVNTHEFPEKMQKAGEVFGVDLFLSCVQDALRGVIVQGV